MESRKVVTVARAAQRLGFPDWKDEAAHKRVKRMVADPRSVLDGYQTRPLGNWWIYTDTIAAHLKESSGERRSDTPDTPDAFPVELGG